MIWKFGACRRKTPREKISGPPCVRKSNGANLLAPDWDYSDKKPKVNLADQASTTALCKKRDRHCTTLIITHILTAGPHELCMWKGIGAGCTWTGWKVQWTVELVVQGYSRLRTEFMLFFGWIHALFWLFFFSSSWSDQTEQQTGLHYRVLDSAVIIEQLFEVLSSCMLYILRCFLATLPALKWSKSLNS